MKNEIYKIAKYQAKLADETDENKNELYRFKLQQHYDTLNENGVGAEKVSKMMGGAPDAFTKSIADTRAKLEELNNAIIDRESGTASQDAKKQLGEITAKHEDMAKDFSNSMSESIKLNNDVQKQLETASGNVQSGISPDLVKKTHGDILKINAEELLTSLMKDLDSTGEPVKSKEKQ